MSDPDVQSRPPRSTPTESDGVVAAGHVPAQHWRLLLPFLLMVLTAAAYYLQNRHPVDAGSLAAALSRHAETVARIDAEAQRAARGERTAFARLRRLKTLAATAQSDTRTMVSSLEETSANSRVGSVLNDADSAWRSVHLAMDQLLDLETATLTLRADVEAFQSIATGILVTTDEMIDALVLADESPQQIRTASRQLLLIQRISANVLRVLEGGDGVTTAADRLGRDAVLFGEVTIALLNGNPGMNIQRVRAPAARDTLVDIGREFRRGTELIEQIMADAVAMVEAREAAARIGESSGQLISHIVELQRQTARLAAGKLGPPMLAEIFGLLALVSLLVAIIHIAITTRRERISARSLAAAAALRDSERESQFASREQATEDAVKRLLDQLDRLARGLAPAEPRLQEDISDTAVAPLEAAIRGLRHRIRILTRSATGLANAGVEFSRTANGARSAADELGTQLERTASATKRMAVHVESVGEHGRRAERISRETNVLVGRARPAVQATESESDKTFTAAKATAARVRQLNESTRKIEEVGRLIDEISEQCRMLSLNVSIRASMSDGSVNPALASFAEEIKKLADNARRAVRQISIVHEDVRSHADLAGDSIKQVMWSAESAASQSRNADKAFTAASVLAQRLEVLNRQLVEALQEHTSLIVNVVRSTTSAHGIAARARQEFREFAARASRLSELGRLLEDAISGFEQAHENQPGIIELHPSRPVELPAADEAPLNAPKEATRKD